MTGKMVDVELCVPVVLAEFVQGRYRLSYYGDNRSNTGQRHRVLPVTGSMN